MSVKTGAKKGRRASKRATKQRKTLTFDELLEFDTMTDDGVTDKVVWVSPAVAAEYCGVTARWLRDLEARGLPCEGERSSKVYPLPTMNFWLTIYKRHQRESPYRSVEYLDALEAEHEYRASAALCRAWCHVREERRVPLDREAVPYVAAAQILIARGERPPTLGEE